jgi:CHAD domain-containing protein
MNQNEICHIKKRHFKKLAQNASMVSQNLQAEAIHQFRVEYKKFRTFLRLDSINLSVDKVVKMSKNLKTWYHVLGHLRDLQLLHHRVIAAVELQPVKPQGYINLIENDLFKFKYGLPIKSLYTAVKTNQKKINKFFQKKISKSNCLQFVTQNLLMVYEILLKGDLADCDFHSVRKYLKDISYYLAIEKLSLSDIVPSSIFNSTDDSYLKYLIEELGKFQDLCSSIILLKSASLESFNLEEQNMLIQVNQQWVQEKELLSKKLKSILIGENRTALHSYVAVIANFSSNEKPVDSVE